MAVEKEKLLQELEKQKNVLTNEIDSWKNKFNDEKKISD